MPSVPLMGNIAMGCPRGMGDKYQNYKCFHSIVMLALVNADYKFILNIDLFGVSF